MSSLLSRPPEEAVRLIALTLLTRVEEAVTRLDDKDDPEALHRFRVSVRRLRSVLRAYRDPLRDSVRKRDRRRLRDLAAVTGEGRDAEVAAAWLEEQRPHLEPGQQQGLDWLQKRLETRRGKGYREARETVVASILPLVDDLRRRLGVYTREVRLEGRGRGDIFGELVGEEVVRELERLEGLLVRVEAAEDTTHVHDARLSAKRLRYLMEPLAQELAAVEVIVKKLKRLQDLLGELNDAYVLENELEDAVETAARKRVRTLLAGALEEEAPRQDGADGEPATDADWSPVDGLLAVARRNRQRRDRLFRELREGWLAESGEEAPRRHELAAAVRNLAHWLEAGFSPPPPASDEPAPTTAP